MREMRGRRGWHKRNNYIINEREPSIGKKNENIVRRMNENEDGKNGIQYYVYSLSLALSLSLPLSLSLSISLSLRPSLPLSLSLYLSLSLSLSFFLSLSPSLLFSVLIIGFDRTMYQVNTLVDSVEVCASVRGGVILDRRVIVQYRTVYKTVVGMECVFV